MTPTPKKRCEEYARRGTGHGTCDQWLSPSGQCHWASDHIGSDEVPRHPLPRLGRGTDKKGTP